MTRAERISKPKLKHMAKHEQSRPEHKQQAKKTRIIQNENKHKQHSPQWETHAERANLWQGGGWFYIMMHHAWNEGRPLGACHGFCFTFFFSLDEDDWPGFEYYSVQINSRYVWVYFLTFTHLSFNQFFWFQDSNWCSNLNLGTFSQALQWHRAFIWT